MNHLNKFACLGLLYLTCSLYLSSYQVSACRVSSEKLKQYAQKTIDNLLEAPVLDSFYWYDEPLPFESLSKITGLNITSASTHFDLSDWENDSQANSSQLTMLQDVFVTCSTGKDRSYTLTINLELKNPFNRVYLRFLPSQKVGNTETGSLLILLPQSTLTVQLNQPIRYDQCFDVNFVQLGSNVNYEIECSTCDELQLSNLKKMLSKKMAQVDAELDLVLSDKFLLGLQYLLSEQRLDLDLYLN